MSSSSFARPSPRIALVTRLSEAEEQAWVTRLQAVLPQELVVSRRGLTPEALAQIEIAIVANPDPADLAGLTGLKWVHSLWAGVERLVAELPPDFSAPVVRLVDPELGRTMAEAVLAWSYYLFRDMPAYARQQRGHVWSQRPYRRPSEVTIAVLGLGALGRLAAERLHGAGFTVRGWSRSPKTLAGVSCESGEAGLEAVLRAADIVVCLVPLTKDTHHLLNARRLAALPKGAQIINFARGPVVDTQALVAALDAGALDHAVLDVFDQEPLPASSSLWDHPSITVLPHISAPTDPLSAAEIVARNIRVFRQTGVIPLSVDFGRGY